MNKLKTLGLASAALAVVAFSYKVNNKVEGGLEVPTKHTEFITENDPPCLQMYYHIEHYADSFNIPRDYAYGIAYCETRYGGPFDWDYNHVQTSYAGALGPMQIMPGTAKLVNGQSVPKEQLMTDIEYNVMTSMKLLRILHNKYGDWQTVFGCYNTGKPCVNGYATKVYNFKPTW
jgi:soluble lytic murein transglycosylase-like protein